jgi:uncharacterized protein
MGTGSSKASATKNCNTTHPELDEKQLDPRIIALESKVFKWKHIPAIFGPHELFVVDEETAHGMDAEELLLYWTQLMVSAGSDGDVERVICALQFLQRVGGNVNTLDERKRSVLNRAVRSGDVELVRWLLARNADMTARGRIGETILHSAISCKRPCDDIVRLLITCGAEMNEQDNQGWTPVMTACAPMHKLHVLQLLLESGCNPNIPNHSGHYPVALACLWQRKAAFEMLVAFGATVDETTMGHSLLEDEASAPLDVAAELQRGKARLKERQATLYQTLQFINEQALPDMVMPRELMAIVGEYVM